jgi:SnoaL-like domain
MPVRADDYVAISDLIGQYCWHVDRGEEDEWAGLWTEAGVFAGPMSDDVIGRDALKLIPRNVKLNPSGSMRHLSGSLSCTYISDDVVQARYYNLVTVWSDDKGELMVMTESVATVVRCEDRWLFQRIDSSVLPKTLRIEPDLPESGLALDRDPGHRCLPGRFLTARSAVLNESVASGSRAAAMFARPWATVRYKADRPPMHPHGSKG